MLRLKFNKTDGIVDLDKKQWAYYLDKLKNGKYVMEIKQYRKNRTLSQNKFYWKVIEIIGNELGYEREEMHASFKATYLGNIDNNGLIHSPTTTNLTTKTMIEYIDKIIRFAARNNIYIPNPKDYEV